MINILVSERIRELMDEKGLTQKQLEHEIGVKQSAISYWLNKQTEPSINSLWLLADYFGVSVDYLIGRVDF